MKRKRKLNNAVISTLHLNTKEAVRGYKDCNYSDKEALDAVIQFLIDNPDQSIAFTTLMSEYFKGHALNSRIGLILRHAAEQLKKNQDADRGKFLETCR